MKLEIEHENGSHIMMDKSLGYKAAVINMNDKCKFITILVLEVFHTCQNTLESTTMYQSFRLISDYNVVRGDFVPKLSEVNMLEVATTQIVLNQTSVPSNQLVPLRKTRRPVCALHCCKFQDCRP